jgi:hypothetical protein
MRSMQEEHLVKILGVPFGLGELVLAIAGLVITGILSVLVSWYFFRASDRVKRISYKSRGLLLLGHESQRLPGAIRVHYNDRPVQQLSRLLIMFWNSGNELVRATDRISADELRIELDRALLLDASIRRTRRDGNNIRLVERHDGISIEFDFLDRGDGALIELLYEGHIQQPTIRGSFQGMYHAIDDRGELRPRDRTELWLAIAFAASFVVLVSTALVFAVQYASRWGWMGVVFAAMMVLMGGMTAQAVREALQRNHPHPVELEDPAVM